MIFFQANIVRSIRLGLWIMLFLFIGFQIAQHFYQITFPTQNFFLFHSFFYLFGLSIFPRITLLISASLGGILWWIGFIFFPRLLIAILASYYYFATNPFLVFLSWVIAINGENLEKKLLRFLGIFLITKKRPSIFEASTMQAHFRPSKTASASEKKNIIDTEYKSI